MNNQLSYYISIEPDFFQELEGEFGVKITGKLANFLRTVEIVRPNRFMTSEMKWCGVGRKKLDREKFFRAFLLKAEFNLPTTKVLIESLTLSYVVFDHQRIILLSYITALVKSLSSATLSTSQSFWISVRFLLLA